MKNCWMFESINISIDSTNYTPAIFSNLFEFLSWISPLCQFAWAVTLHLFRLTVYESVCVYGYILRCCFSLPKRINPTQAPPQVCRWKWMASITGLQTDFEIQHDYHNSGFLLPESLFCLEVPCHNGVGIAAHQVSRHHRSMQNTL